MLDRYSQKDETLRTLAEGDVVLTIIKDDRWFPTRGIGEVIKIDHASKHAHVLIEAEYAPFIDPAFLVAGSKNVIKQLINNLDKPLELFYEQIATRVSSALASMEKNFKNIVGFQKIFCEEMISKRIVPAGRVLFGSGSNTDVTLLNCFVMPLFNDSRHGIAEHRRQVMEIMSHGGGVGSNGSTLRPRGAVAKSVGGRSSGAVSWLHDLSTLTHLVQQGGSRRGAQMIMLADWHPDIINFVISKMQNTLVLQWLKDNAKDEMIKKAVREKISFKNYDQKEMAICESIVKNANNIDSDIVASAQKKLNEKGEWVVNNPEFLSGANISVLLSDDFMHAVKEDKMWALKYPDLDSYNSQEKATYDQEWEKSGDVREWEARGFAVKTYYTMKARDLWDLITFCANYSAEPGIFFIDRANEMTNASAYDMKVVATNPCGEQPLAPWSVCNLAAINLSEFVNKKTHEILWLKLEKTIRVMVRMQDNVIDATSYFFDVNEKQAKGERRVGMGVMGLHDMLIWANYCYGSDEANQLVDKLFKFICETAYEASSNLAKEKGSFPFLVDNERFVNTGFMKKMKPEIRNLIRKQGIRNSHLLTVAPTGSTATLMSLSTGLEPYFAFNYLRSGRLGNKMKVVSPIIREWLTLHPEYEGKDLPDIFVSAMDLSPEKHVAVHCTIQKWIDSSVSKTVNAPKGYSVRDVQTIYMELYDKGAKGGTVYVDGSRDSQVLSLDKEDDAIAQPTIKDFGLHPASTLEDDEKVVKKLGEKVILRGLNQDRSKGINVGDVCPMCGEGTMVNSGGCSTCSNCNVQLKCGL